jgi:membrane-bound metal-dependent hydrolase YbcI (DUF457 family)
MTTFEHAMVGVNGTLAVGLHRRYAWPIVAMAGVAAVVPDWDGLSILFGARVFDQVHRAVGHNLLVAVLVGAVLAAIEYRYGVALRLKEFAGKWLRMFASEESPPQRSRFRASELFLWVAVGITASLSHLAGDLVFSGHETLSDWGLKLLWPFSDQVWAYPLVHWGDPGVTLIFVGGMFAMIRWRPRVQGIALLTLILVVGYIALRGALGG